MPCAIISYLVDVRLMAHYLHLYSVPVRLLFSDWSVWRSRWTHLVFIYLEKIVFGMSRLSYNIVLFGSARLQPDSSEYQDVYTISRELTKRGISVSCVGGPGLMEACRSGRDQVLLASGSQFDVADVQQTDIRSPMCCDNLASHFQYFTRRMDRFLTESKSIVVAPGGVGTLLELLYCLHSCQVRKVIAPPILLFGQIWQSFMVWWNEQLLAKGLVSPEDSASITCFEDVASIIEQIDVAYQRAQLQEHSKPKL